MNTNIGRKTANFLTVCFSETYLFASVAVVLNPQNLLKVFKNLFFFWPMKNTHLRCKTNNQKDILFRK